MKIITKLSLVTFLSVSSYAGTLLADAETDTSPNMPDISVSTKSNVKKTNNSISQSNIDQTDIVSEEDSTSVKKIKKSNDVLTKTQNSELLNNPEVVRLINEAYKNGFTAGAEESEFVMKKKLDKMSKYMDSLFAFHKLYLEGKLEPPKIGIVNEPVQVTKNGKVMVIQQEYMEIIEPAKFVDQPKTWKNFLID